MKSTCSFLLLGSLLMGRASAFVVTPHHHGAAISGTALCSIKAREKYKKKIAYAQVEGIEEKFLLNSLEAFNREEFDAARTHLTRVADRLIGKETLSEVITNQLLGKYSILDSVQISSALSNPLRHMLQGPP